MANLSWERLTGLDLATSVVATFGTVLAYGPLLAKLTTFYGVYHAYVGDIHIDIERLHQKHGTFVRYGPNALVAGSIDGFHDIYDSGKNFRKSKSYIVHGAENLLGIRDKGKYSRKKRIFAPAFSDSAIREYEPKVLQSIQEFCEKMAAPDSSIWSEPKDVSSWCNYLTLDIITRVVFTTTWSLLSSPINRGVTDISAAVVHLIGIAHQSAWLYSYKFTTLILFPRLAKSISGLSGYTMNIMQSSMKAHEVDPGLKDIFAQLLKAKDPESKTGEGLAKGDVRVNSSNLLVAGSDTSSSAMAATFFYLSRNKDAYEKVATEVRKAFQSGSDVRSGAALNGCVYLRATINEAMRMSPVVAQPLWREVESGGASIAGQHVPAGMNVGAGIYTLHHNPSVFLDPYTYNIDRWIIDEKKDAKEEKQRIKECQRSFAPFSAGPRQCIAKNFAMMELMLTMANVLVRMDFENLGHVGDGGKGMGEGRERKGRFQLKSYFTSHMEGPVIRFRRRGGMEETVGTL